MTQDVHDDWNLFTGPSEFAVIGSEGILFKLGWQHQVDCTYTIVAP